MFTVKDIVQVTDSGLTTKAYHKVPPIEGGSFPSRPMQGVSFHDGLRDLTHIANEYAKAAKVMARVYKQDVEDSDMTIEEMIHIHYPDAFVSVTEKTRRYKIYRVGQLIIHAKLSK